MVGLLKSAADARVRHSAWQLVQYLIACSAFVFALLLSAPSHAVIIWHPPGWNPDPTIDGPPYDDDDNEEPPPPDNGCEETMGALNRSHEKDGSKNFQFVFQTTPTPPPGPKPPPCPYTPETPPPCCEPCGNCNGPPNGPGPGPGPGPDGNGPFVGPSTSSFPVMLRDGALVENVTDLEIPGPGFMWKVNRNYRSVAYAPDGTTTFGNKWFSSDSDMRLMNSGSEVVLILSSSSQRKFTNLGGTFSSPLDSNLLLTYEQVGMTSTYQYVVTDELSGEVLVFNDFDSSGMGQLHERTTRYRRAQGRAGAIYTYDSYKRLYTVTLPQGQDYFIKYDYEGSTARCTKIRVWQTASMSLQLYEINYTYFHDSDTSLSPYVGSEGDLIQVSVKRRDSSLANWIERDTQYRYYRGGSGASSGYIKAIYEHDAVQRLRAANGCSTLPALCGVVDCGTIGGGGGGGTGAPIKGYASRWISYYTWDEGGNSTHYNTLFNSDEDLTTKYGGTNVDEVVEGGPVREESIGASCAACGGSDHSVKKRYHYIYMNKPGSSAHAYYVNHGSKADINEVSFLVIEDTATQSGTPLYRKIYGLNDYYRKLREVFIENPTDSNPRRCWCQAWIYSNSTSTRELNRVSEYRGPATYTVTTDAKIKQFFDPYNAATTSWTNDTAVLSGGGEIKLYEYNSDGFLTKTLSKNGVSGAAYCTAATDYSSAGLNSLPIATYTYPAQLVSGSYTSGIKTEYQYTFWDTNNTQIKTVITKLPKIAASQNGPGNGSGDPQIQTEEYYDSQGRLRWTKDGEGYVNYYSYSPNSGKLAYTAIDVDPTSLPSSADDSANSTKWSPSTSGSASTNKPTRAIGSGTLPTALALVTTDEFDLLERQRLHTDPRGHQHYTAYQLAGTGCSQLEWTIQLPYWSGSAPQLPISVEELDHTSKLHAMFTLLTSTALTAGTGSASGPVGLTYAPTVANYQTLTQYTNDPKDGTQIHIDRYHTMPSTLPGTLSTNFDRTGLAYDAEGRLAATVNSIEGTNAASATVQVAFNELDKYGRPKNTLRWRDTGFNFSTGLAFTGLETTALTKHPVSSIEYDGGGVGDGYVTATKRYFGTGSSDYTKTQYFRTYRGHLRSIRNAAGTTVYSPYPTMNLDWLGRTIVSASYKNAGAWISVISGDDGYGNGVAGNPGTRNDFTKTHYDDLGRVYQIERFPGTEGTKHFETNNYYDRNGQLVCTGNKYGSHKEYAFDGASRRYQSRVVLEPKLNSTTGVPYDSSTGAFQYRLPVPKPSYADMTNGADKVIELRHRQYGTNGVTDKETDLVVGVYQVEVTHDHANGVDFSTSTSYVRSTGYQWYNPADQLVTTANYGAGGGSTGLGTWKYNAVPSRPAYASRPTASADDVLVTKYTYNPGNAQQETATDPAGIVTKTFYDKLGRRLFVVENLQGTYDPTSSITPVTAGQNRTTGWLYNGLYKTTKLTAYNSGSTTNQETEYQYTDAYNAKLVTLTKYPDGSVSGTDNVQTTYNLDGTPATRTDQRGVVMAFAYDSARRLKAEQVTSFGSSGTVDTTVQSITHLYDDFNRAMKITSHHNVTDDPNDTTDIKNQIVYTIGTQGLVTKTEQSHSGAVTTGTPTVQYDYDTTEDTSHVYTNGLRTNTVTYPNSTTVAYYGYGSSGSIDDVLNRVNHLTFQDLGADYAYNGVGRLVITANGVTSVSLDYYQGTSGTYAGFDRFGRIVDQRWIGANGDVARIKYGYDHAGNRSWHQDVVAAANSVALDEFYTYDGLKRLTNSQRGSSLTGMPYSGVTSRNFEQDFTLDQLSNWSIFKERDTDTGSTWDLNQSRTHNAANELTEIASSSTYVAEDTAGNMTKIPKPTSWTANFDLKYDAWNRLVEVKDGGTTIAINKYDGLGRRIQRIVGSDTYGYYYNEKWQLLEDRKNGASSPPQNQYLWHPYYIDALAIRQGSGISYCANVYDANYNVVAVVDDNGGVLERYSYTPYGEVKVMDDTFTPKSGNATTIGNSHFYTGRELDSETGLQLNRHRFYAAHLGRWLTRDQLEYRDSSDLYEYVLSCPTGRQDPTGLRCVTCSCSGSVDNYGDGPITEDVNVSVDCKMEGTNLTYKDCCAGSCPTGTSSGSAEPCENPPAAPLGLPEPTDCFSRCLKQHAFSNWGTGTASTANAAANKCCGGYPRAGLGGPRPSGATGGVGSPGTWEHRLFLGTRCSKCAKFVGRACVALTVAEGFCDIGAEAACGLICADCYPGVDKNQWVK